ncbi:unnamed protein product, partial [Heterosigma akashiwo]
HEVQHHTSSVVRMDVNTNLSHHDFCNKITDLLRIDASKEMITGIYGSDGALINSPCFLDEFETLNVDVGG